MKSPKVWPHHCWNTKYVTVWNPQRFDHTSLLIYQISNGLKSPKGLTTHHCWYTKYVTVWNPLKVWPHITAEILNVYAPSLLLLLCIISKQLFLYEFFPLADLRTENWHFTEEEKIKKRTSRRRKKTVTRNEVEEISVTNF